MAADSFFIGSDNLVTFEGLVDSDGEYINDATMKMSLYEEDPLNPTNGIAISEVQTIQPDAPATAGTFTITYHGQTTGAIPWNATTSVVRAYLELLSTVYPGNITVSGDIFSTDPVMGGMIFTFADTLGDVNALTMAVGSLTGVALVTIVETVKGILEEAAVQELQKMIGDAAATGGTFTLTYKGDTTAAINWDDELADYKTALEALDSVAADDITVGGECFNDGTAGVTFEFADTLGNVPMITIDVSSLTNVTSVISTEERQGRLGNVAIDEGGGLVGIPVEDHGMVATETIRIQGTQNYDGEETIVSVEEDKIVITATYAAEEFHGEEEIFLGVEGGIDLTLTEDGESVGTYKGTLPNTLKGIDHESFYQLFIKMVDGSFNVLLNQVTLEAIYSPGE